MGSRPNLSDAPFAAGPPAIHLGTAKEAAHPSKYPPELQPTYKPPNKEKAKRPKRVDTSREVERSVQAAKEAAQKKKAEKALDKTPSKVPGGIDSSTDTADEDVGELVLAAIRALRDPNGSTLKDVKKYLSSLGQLDVAAKSAEIKTFVTDALKEGYLIKENGRYKATQKRRRCKSGKKEGESQKGDKKKISCNSSSTGTKKKRNNKKDRAESKSRRSKEPDHQFDKVNTADRPSKVPSKKTRRNMGDIGDLVLTAFRKLKEPNGSTLKDVKKYLSSVAQLDVAAKNLVINLFVAKATKKGYLAKADGKYKTTKRRRRSNVGKTKGSKNKDNKKKSSCKSTGMKTNRSSAGRRKRRTQSKTYGQSKNRARRSRRKKAAASKDV